MNHILVVGKGLNIFSDLCDLFEKRNITIVKFDENNNLTNSSSFSFSGLNTDTIVCSEDFEKFLGGQDKLLVFARENKIKKILIIAENKKLSNYSTTCEFGGALRRVTFNDIYHKTTKEIIFHLCNPNNLYSAGDEKTFELLSLSRRVALTDVTVFINGPTGSGKEVLANYLHENSLRKDNSFVAVNCAAIPENMLEAILFGHEKGAFTGASYANKGIFRAADNGTLLLDEISEMPLSLQAKLLRVLQEKKVTPVGGQRDIEVDVRVLATSNRDMVTEVKQSRFREDLYYRLNVFPLQTRNLKDRKDDIIPICLKILDKHSKDQIAPIINLEAQEIILNHDWPGNVRELENALQRALVLCEGGVIDKKSIMIDNALTNISSEGQVENIISQYDIVGSRL